MTTLEEIRQRVHDADTTRSAKRAAAAQQVAELARRHAAITEQLEDTERQLGDALAAAQDVISIDELAEFTDLKATDLAHWLAERRTTRTKRKKPAITVPGTPSNTSREPSTPTTSPTPRASQPTTSTTGSLPRPGGPNGHERATAPAT